MAHTYVDADGAVPATPASASAYAEQLAMARLYRDAELKKRPSSIWEFELFPEEDRLLAKAYYEVFITKGSIIPDPVYDDPGDLAVLTKSEKYARKATDTRLAIKGEVLGSDNPADRKTAWDALRREDQESYFRHKIGGDPIRLHVANQMGITMEDLLP